VTDGLALHLPVWNAVVKLLKQRREQISALKESSARKCSLEELTVCRTMASQARIP
jgi:hypothetical protein